ncbi:MAG: hypothetical protein DA407_05220 [Bacteroidetes bacterium]|nr:MAG: hypothetical protein DA407_05220 [Bacteroidota bacterium]
MGFGGSGSMNVVLRNNKKLLSKREKFKKTLGGYVEGKKTEYDFPKAQRHMLKRIKERMIYDNGQILKRRIIAFIAVSIILITGIIYIL